jgi:hypothetical protein
MDTEEFLNKRMEEIVYEATENVDSYQAERLHVVPNGSLNKPSILC